MIFRPPLNWTLLLPLADLPSRQKLHTTCSPSHKMGGKPFWTKIHIFHILFTLQKRGLRYVVNARHVNCHNSYLYYLWGRYWTERYCCQWLIWLRVKNYIPLARLAIKLEESLFEPKSYHFKSFLHYKNRAKDHTIHTLKIIITFKGLLMLLVGFFDISNGFGVEKDGTHCSLHLLSTSLAYLTSHQKIHATCSPRHKMD